MPNFVEFSRQDSRRDDDPMFTLQIRGLISMNQAAYKALGTPAAVALMYDADEGIVALRKVAKNYANGYLIRKVGNSNSYLVAAQGFVSFNKIANEVSRRFTGHEYAEFMWGFDLAEGAEIKGARRSGDSDEGAGRQEASTEWPTTRHPDVRDRIGYRDAVQPRPRQKSQDEPSGFGGTR